MNLSKSKYVLGKRCEKLMWLSTYKKDEAEESNDNVLENGNKVGELARELFGKEYILIEYNESNKQEMIDETSKYLIKKPNIICEASFSYNNNFCSIDILKNDIDGVEIYEVKSSTEINKSYIDDISYQTWILKKLGLKVKKSFLVYVNSDYVLHGKLDLNKYFNIKDVTDLIEIDIDEDILKLNNIINMDKEPKKDLSLNCKKNKNISYNCPFFKYCTKHLVSPNVFDVGCYVHFDKKLEMYYENKISYEDVLSMGGLGENANEQMEFEINDLKPKINTKNIKSFLNTITYPIYFLDFESYQAVIPTIEGTTPYQQICFQYSLHYYLSKDDKKLYHKEYLSDDYDGNPMYGLCKRLCEDIPMNTSVIVYNQSFEKTRLKEMANLFPEFKEHLLNIEENIIDLLPIFRCHDYYVKEMNGSSSIKQVLPALFPNDSELDYHNLDQVHKGDEASSAYLSLKDLNKEEEKELRYNMLKYCKLDTYAMVKIYDRLVEVTSE